MKGALLNTVATTFGSGRKHGNGMNYGSEEEDRDQTAGLEQRPSGWQKRWLYTGPSETDSRCAQSTWCRWAQRSGPILDGDRYHAAWTQPALARCLRRAEPQRFYPYPY